MAAQVLAHQGDVGSGWAVREMRSGHGLRCCRVPPRSHSHSSGAFRSEGTQDAPGTLPGSLSVCGRRGGTPHPSAAQVGLSRSAGGGGSAARPPCRPALSPRKAAPRLSGRRTASLWPRGSGRSSRRPSCPAGRLPWRSRASDGVTGRSSYRPTAEPGSDRCRRPSKAGRTRAVRGARAPVNPPAGAPRSNRRRVTGGRRSAGGPSWRSCASGIAQQARRSMHPPPRSAGPGSWR